jgi:hypothetical protein
MERMNPNDLFGGWFSALCRFKTLTGAKVLILGACLILPCSGPPGIAVYQVYYEGHYRKKNSHPHDDAMEVQTPKSR